MLPHIKTTPKQNELIKNLGAQCKTILVFFYITKYVNKNIGSHVLIVPKIYNSTNLIKILNLYFENIY